MKLFTFLIVALAVVALVGHYIFHSPSTTFIFSAAALVLLSKIMGDATEHLAYHVGQSYAGFVNVTLGNFAELIIIFAAVRAGMIDLVKAGIVGSIVGHLLFVMGLAIIVGCRKHKKIKLNPETVTLLINQLFLVGSTLALPKIFSSIVPEENQLRLNYVLAAMLAGAYVFYHIALAGDERMRPVREQARDKAHHNGWSLKFSVFVLLATVAGAFVLSEILLDETEQVGREWGMSQAMLGFMLLPLIGSLAEHFVAVVAAHKGLGELSLAVAVGSASQIGMVIVPAAVLFGALYNVPITLDFSGLPLSVLVMALMGGYIVLRDNQWRMSEGIMLLALYLAMLVCFWFAR